MIVGAITGTGVICMFAIIAGLAFGGVRLVVKRATNRVFDRPDQVQVLQLGLSSKPIKSRTSTDTEVGDRRSIFEGCVEFRVNPWNKAAYGCGKFYLWHLTQILHSTRLRSRKEF